MPVVKAVTGVLLLAFAAVFAFMGAELAFGPDAGDISSINGTIRLIGWALLLVGAALGWFGLRLMRRRTRPLFEQRSPPEVSIEEARQRDERGEL